MVDQSIETMYDQIIAYITGKVGYYTDPAVPDKEFNDFIQEFDLAEVVYNIQRQIKTRPTLSESSIIKAYRDIRATQAEYDIRLMTRADYFTDSSEEEEDNKNKWTYNKKLVGLHIQGKDVGA